MKRSSSHKNSNCLQQLSEAQQLIALLQQTVMNLQQHSQILAEQCLHKDAIITGQQHIIAAQKTELELKEQTIAALAQQVEQNQRIIQKQHTIIAGLQQQLEKNKAALFDYKMLRYDWMQLRKMIYGRKSEKRYPDVTAAVQQGVEQGLLFDTPATGAEAVKLEDVKKIKERMVVVKKPADKAPHPGRQALPAHLERREVRVEQPVPEGAVKVGEERTERLAISPFKAWVNVEVRDIYIIKADTEGKYKQLIAPPLPHPIPKCQADVSLLVLLVIDKYLYHLPVWRQQQRFRQQGIQLSYPTLSRWTTTTIEVLRPLWELLWLELKVSGYMHMDETKHRVLDRAKTKGKQSHNGYLWVAGNPVQKIVCFTYKKGRGKDEVKEILSGFKGYLHTDAYSGYEGYGKQSGVIHLHCMDHARRYFVEAQLSDEKTSTYALDHFFAPLYDIERECKEKQLCYDEITEVRKSRSVPLLNALRGWLTQQITQVIEGTPIYKAMAYTLKRMKQLMAYTEDGMLCISNMFVEQSIRPTKVGLKNYLFSGSHEHAERTAIIYSLIQTCKLQGIDPTAYLQDVLVRIGEHKQNKLSELLPQNWKPRQQQAETTLKKATA